MVRRSQHTFWKYCEDRTCTREDEEFRPVWASPSKQYNRNSNLETNPFVPPTVNAFDRDFAAARHPLPPREKLDPQRNGTTLRAPPRPLWGSSVLDQSYWRPPFRQFVLVRRA